MHRRQASGLLAVLAITVACIGAGLLYAGEPVQYSVEGGRSGDTYLSPENQRLQDDECANPGLLSVEQGRDLWHQADGTSLHPQGGKLINLEQQRISFLKSPATARWDKAGYGRAGNTAAAGRWWPETDDPPSSLSEPQRNGMAAPPEPRCG